MLAVGFFIGMFVVGLILLGWYLLDKRHAQKRGQPRKKIMRAVGFAGWAFIGYGLFFGPYVYVMNFHPIFFPDLVFLWNVSFIFGGVMLIGISVRKIRRAFSNNNRVQRNVGIGLSVYGIFCTTLGATHWGIILLQETVLSDVSSDALMIIQLFVWIILLCSLLLIPLGLKRAWDRQDEQRDAES
ncbi:MAG TPA: hypothetical protein VEU97_12595 [Ktedonobacteraceae bacterium]|nr:hypothetical protein [Ktedonobacteraceae bacterium]